MKAGGLKRPSWRYCQLAGVDQPARGEPRILRKVKNLTASRLHRLQVKTINILSVDRASLTVGRNGEGQAKGGNNGKGLHFY